HGSHNATLRAQGLERMTRRDLVAFLPVDEFVARKKAGYGEMPLKSLVKELLIRTGGRIARNDEGQKPQGANATLGTLAGAPDRDASFADNDHNPLYFEYVVPAGG